jgi:hypothetical protein
MTQPVVNSQVNPTRFTNGIIPSVVHLIGATDVIPVRHGFVFLDGSVVDATTLVQPTAGITDAQPNGQDGVEIIIIDTGGHAHTVTTSSTPVLGIVPSHHLITFGGTAGSWVRLVAGGGLWYPLSSSGVTISQGGIMGAGHSKKMSKKKMMDAMKKGKK